MKDKKSPGAAGHEPHDHDPWGSVSRDTMDTIRGEPPRPRDDIDDTTTLIRSGGDPGIAVSEPDAATAQGEMVELLSHSIADAPHRVDLWAMRFEMYRALGMKPEFFAAMRAAWKHATVRRTLDWRSTRQLWEALAPGEPMPEEVVLTETAPAAPRPAVAGEVRVAGTQRRFADIALHSAGEALTGLARAYGALRADAGFFDKLAYAVGPVINRPTPLHYAQSLTRTAAGNSRIFLKREEQRRIAPEIENAVGQCWVARALGKNAIVSGSDVDAHAQALALVAPRFELECLIYVRPSDLSNSTESIDKLRARGTRVEKAGDQSADPRVSALDHWRLHLATTHLALSPGTGPRPFPMMVNDFQSLLGREAEGQLRSQGGAGRPRTFIASPQGESDSIGFVLPHLNARDIELFFTEPPAGVESTSRRSAWLRSYNGMAREHGWLRASGRIRYVQILNETALAMQKQVRQLEGVEVSLEDARAIVQAMVLARISRRPSDIVVLTG